MPQKTSVNSNFTNKKESGMGTFVKTIAFILVAIVSFGGGYFTANQGYKVTDSQGASLVKSNAINVVKSENSQLGKEVLGKSEADAEALLAKANRTMFVANRDGTTLVNTGQKTFSNLTVEVKDGKVVKVLGWY